MKHYVVTGANRGIGLELVKQLLAKECRVYAVVRDLKNADDLQDVAKHFPESLSIFEADVSSDAQVELFSKDLQKQLNSSQGIDVLINNAGVYGSSESFRELSLSAVERTFSVNAVSPMRVTRALLPLLQKSKTAKVVHITSLMGSLADNTSGGSYGYRMSKAALNMFHRSFVWDFKQITSLVVHPGWVKTDMGGPNAPTSVEESARGIIAVIDKTSLKDSGRFLDFEGDDLPW